MTDKTALRTCHYCSKPSSSLLRCTQCKSAYYCNRTCQSAAWDPAGSTGHRSVCRQLRKRAAAAASSSTDVNGDAVANEAWKELENHVQRMNCDEAYRQMCWVQDEIQRLQSCVQLDNQSEMISSSSIVETPCPAKDNKCGEEVETCHDPDSNNICNEISDNQSKLLIEHIISGSWMLQGGICSVEFLPNVKCYLITLKSNDRSCCIPSSRDVLKFDVSLMENEDTGSDVSLYIAKLYDSNIDNPILFLKLPADSSIRNGEPASQYSISLDKNSISIRLQFHDAMPGESTAVIDELLCMNTSAFSSTTSDAKSFNYLCCRTCLNSIIRKNNDDMNQCVIRSVLPLPDGYWDEITDYLICYEGQPTVEFNSSSASAIRNTALEDDAILILHDLDIEKELGICELNVKGYGEHSFNNDDSAFVESASQPWKDKSSRTGSDAKTIACAVCCSTLGFVSNHDTSTYRFYKHLLSCDVPDTVPNRDTFARHTCGSFLAREMIRYAESEAIYTFIVETESHSTSSRCILLRMLSWDSLVGTVDSNAQHVQYQKVLKVIFEETIIKSAFMTSDNPMDWRWGGLDLCCPPMQNNGDKTLMGLMTNMHAQTKATSVRICLSSGEWHELKHSLMVSSQYFSEAVRDAVVMTKLGVLPGKGLEDSAALLSFLPIVT